jgi:hypothetical protein
MYATRLANQIYHLVPANAYHTLCGLRVSRLPLGAKLPGNLQLVEKVPASKNICKHCERIQDRSHDRSPELLGSLLGH